MKVQADKEMEKVGDLLECSYKCPQPVTERQGDTL